jgi:hypothetical protein
MARIKLLFLPSKTPSTHKSKHEQELEVQEARAHAASIAHHRAGRGANTRTGQQREQPSRRGGGGGGGVGTVADPTYSRWLLPVVAVGEKSAAAKRHPRDLQDRNVKAQQSQGLAWIKTGPLDPFLQLPVELDIKERNMLFYCEWLPFPRLVHMCSVYFSTILLLPIHARYEVLLLHRQRIVAGPLAGWLAGGGG